MTRYAPCLLALLAVSGLLAALGLAFVHAPVEAQMGVVQKIFYFHVPAAYTMYLAWGICTAASVAYLFLRREGFDILARSAGELAALFASMVMITGPLWGRKAWGAYWAWDPRLTSTLLLTLIIFAYAALRSLGTGEVERRFAAALAIVGACLLPVIHFSVSAWRGHHPTVIRGGGMTAEMGLALAVSLIAFTLLLAALLVRRHLLESGLRRLAALEERAVVAGLPGEDRR